MVRASGAGHGISSDGALRRLKAGHQRFIQEKSNHPNTAPSRIWETAKGQKPIATVIGCSDSRVPIERILDQGFGDLFVVRVAGNVCDVDEIGSAEFAIGHPHTPLIVVMGHTHCGAVAAVALGAHERGKIPLLVDNIGPAVARVKKLSPEAHGDALIALAVKENVWQGMHDLFVGSSMVRGRVRAGKLKVVGAIYDIETGRVDWMGPHREQDRLMARRSKRTGQR